MALLATIKPNGPSGFGYGSTAEGVTAGLSLDGRTYLLTGCNSGLGFETLRVLTLRGALVIAAARTLEKSRAACASVKGQTTPVACELAEPASVRATVLPFANLSSDPSQDYFADGRRCSTRRAM